MERLYLLATIAGERVAFEAARVESVIEIEQVAPVPRAPAHLAGIAPLRSRVLTVIDCHAALGLPASPRRGVMPAIAVKLEGHLYGLLVDSVDDVVPLADIPIPLSGRLAPGWAHAARAGLEHEGALLLLVDPAAFVAGPPAARAA